MPVPPLDRLPGFRRRFIVTPGPGWVRSEVEDDYHGMGVTLRHDGKTATALEPEMRRAPWTTCPGALVELQRTFTNIPLKDFPARGQRPVNCTHLHDLAVLAAAHAEDAEPLIYDILVSDPIGGRQRSQLRRNGMTVMSWVLENGCFVEPKVLVGVRLDGMRPWIGSLDPTRQEEARLLRWGTMIAHGRTMSLDEHADATRIPAGSCYTSQPHIIGTARRMGEIRDFSTGAAQPLEREAAALRPDRHVKHHR
jgi:hypothetical protein